MSDGWEPSNAAREPAEDRSATGRIPRSLAELVLGLWRTKWLMILVGSPIFALGIAYALTLKPEYTARSRLFVSLSEEYVYRPRVGGAAEGLATDIEQVLQAEMEILRSPRVAELVLRRFGLERVYPDLAKLYEETPPAGREAVFMKGVDSMLRDFSAEAAPKTPVIATGFTHRDAQLSADILNALIGSYLTYRSEIFSQGRVGGLTDQRERFEGEMLTAEAAITAFLRENAIGDFDAERASTLALLAAVDTELLQVDARTRAVAGEIGILQTQLAATPQDINLYTDDGSSQELQALELEREQLLTRFRPDSTPVREVEKKIAQLRQFLGTRPEAAGLVRRGANPLYQELESRLSRAQSEAASLAEQRASLVSQKSGFEVRAARLNALAPQYQELLRRKALFESNLASFAGREVEEAALRELSKSETDTIRIIAPARPPARGSSAKLPVAVASLLLAGMTALAAGLLAALSRRFLEMPGLLGKATGLPVLAVTRRR